MGPLGYNLSTATSSRSTSQATSSSTNVNFVYNINPTVAKTEYTAIAMRGHLLQFKKGGEALPPPPNKFGITQDGIVESTKPTAAPIARWRMANKSGKLQSAFTFRLGVNPSSIEFYRENGQVTMYVGVDNVNADFAKRTENGPVHIRTSTNPNDAHDSHNFFCRLPEAIPTDQPVYRHTHQNVLLGQGICSEDSATQRYWKRPREVADVGIQHGNNAFKTITEDTRALSIQQAPVDWNELVARLPAEFLRRETEMSLVEPLIEIFKTGRFDIHAHLIVACKTTHLN
ncbi:MAG TPA: hypothetical protein VK861_02835, partial [Bacteroidales bacterium]|nr:hypothetical protein [Bacteroidales bacterium]